jgi:DNA polymerase-3 subunit gamma/tau
MEELYKKHRPDDFDGIIGQGTTLKILEALVDNDEIPHFILFIGPKGCGKTTLARIMRRKLKCGRQDFKEIAPRKIEEVRVIRSRISLAPMRSKCRVYLIDECHKLTPDAQDEFLKMLEDTPSHVYFIFTTTKPQKLIKPLRDRATEFAVKPLSDDNLSELVMDICRVEKTKVDKEVIEKIVANSDGSARKALVFLNSVIRLKFKKDQLDAIIPVTTELQAFEIVRALLYKPVKKWKEMAVILKATEGEDAEQIRWLVLACCKTEMLKASHFAGRAYVIISVFRDNYFDSKMAGLAADCYEVIEGAKD